MNDGVWVYKSVPGMHYTIYIPSPSMTTSFVLDSRSCCISTAFSCPCRLLFPCVSLVPLGHAPPAGGLHWATQTSYSHRASPFFNLVQDYQQDCFAGLPKIQVAEQRKAAIASLIDNPSRICATRPFLHLETKALRFQSVPLVMASSGDQGTEVPLRRHRML